MGKLPDRADFVRRGPPSPVLDHLDDLSQRALRSKPGKAGPLWRTVFAPPGAHALVGALQLGRDAVGRAFPLVAGRTVEQEGLDPDGAAAWPLRWRSLCDASASLVTGALYGDASLEAADRQRDALPLLAPAHGRSDDVDAHVRALSSLPAAHLWQRIWGRPDPGLAAVVFRQLARMPRRSPSYGIEFPLPTPAPDFRTVDAVAFWLAVCWHLVPTASAPPTLFWTSGPGRLVAFFGDLAVPAFRALLVGASDTDRIARIDDGPAGDPARVLSDLPSDLHRALMHPNATVADILARLHTLR
ncbi:MAG: type VI secretion system-associated protein TagF [Bacteroidota bacterium]